MEVSENRQVLIDAALELRDMLDVLAAGEEDGRSLHWTDNVELAQQIAARVEGLQWRTVRAARADEGASWAAIGNLYEVSRQAAQQRWADENFIAPKLTR
ncbi:hypothetical protein [Actinotalea sp. C106]|uniref:hypothetical protein n=1 Tax=Actinotalea sp. C106 TaxID=2908644 RepID=UPI0020288337|nr:hypothetical protein [Actinotalea sp. C106]